MMDKFGRQVGRRLFGERRPVYNQENLRLLLTFFAPELGPNRRAAAEAVLTAQTMPGSLIRIVFTDSDQIYEVIAVAEHIMRTEGWLDEEKTHRAIRSSHPTLELRNGSGIEFELEFKSEHTGKTYSSRTGEKKPT